MAHDATALGADFIHYALAIALFWVAYLIGRRVSDRTRKLLPGWIAGIAFLVVAGLLLGPLISSLNSIRCGGDAICEQGPTPEY